MSRTRSVIQLFPKASFLKISFYNFKILLYLPLIVSCLFLKALNWAVAAAGIFWLRRVQSTAFWANRFPTWAMTNQIKNSSAVDGSKFGKFKRVRCCLLENLVLIHYFWIVVVTLTNSLSFGHIFSLFVRLLRKLSINIIWIRYMASSKNGDRASNRMVCFQVVFFNILSHLVTSLFVSTEYN